MSERIRQHGENLLAIFPQATERDPQKLCRKLRRLEREGERMAVVLSSESGDTDQHEKEGAALLAKVNKLLGNVRKYQPKTGAKCGCRRGVERDNCPNCEGTGHVVDFHAIRNAPPVVPVFLNSDPRGYALKILSEYVAKHELSIHRDWGGYGILAPDLTED